MTSAAPLTPSECNLQDFPFMPLEVNYTCRYCGARGVRLEADHVIPVARGGATCMKNLATACFPCNRSKGSKLPEEWRGA